MDELIIEYLQGRLDAAGQAQVDAWRAALPQNEERYRAVEAIWSMTDAASAAATSEHPSADEIVHLAQRPHVHARHAWTAVVGGAARFRRKRLSLDHSPRLLRAAIIAIVCTAVGMAVGQSGLFRSDSTEALAYTSIRTGQGELTTITLDDGSSIRLGPLSTIEMRPSSNGVVAHLEGRAFFGITPGRDQPFVVRTQFGEATVLGTRFEVRSEADRLQVLVVEGKVQVRPSGSSNGFLLADRQLASVDANGEATKATVGDVHDRLAWMGNVLVFHDTPLADVVQELSDKYGMQVVLGDPELGSTLITATFMDQTLKASVQVICQMLNSRCLTTDAQVVIGYRAP